MANSSLLRLTRYAPAIRCGLPTTAVCGALASASFVSVPLILERVVDHIGIDHPGPEVDRVLPVLLLTLAIVLVGAASSYAVYHRMYTAAETTAKQIRTALLALYLRRDREQDPDLRSGNAVALMTVDVEIVARFFRTLGVLTVLNVGQLLTAVVLLAAYSWLLALVVVVSALPARLLARPLLARSSRAFLQVRSHLGTLLASLTEYLHHQRPLRHLRAHQFMEDRISVLLQRYHSDQKRAELLSAGMSAAIEVWATLSLAVSLGAGAWLMVEGRLTVGELVASIFLVQLLTGPVQTVAETLNSLQNAGAASKRILDGLRRLSRPMPVQRVTSAEENSPNGELLRFEKVTHGYGGPAAGLSLRGATFWLASGSTTALVGRSGSGKSTIARLMAGMLVPQSGKITITGAPRRLSDIVTFVPDDVQLLTGSLRDNLSYPSRPRSDDELFHALEKLSLARWLTTFENGLATDVTTEGLDLIDRQRIALVRTLLSRPELVVFDESLSAVSADTALGLCESLHTVLPDLCVVLVTHLPSLAQRCDDVVVLSRGVVVGQGPGDVLLKTCAEYRALVGSQVPGRTDERRDGGGYG